MEELKPADLNAIANLTAAINNGGTPN